MKTRPLCRDLFPDNKKSRRRKKVTPDLKTPDFGEIKQFCTAQPHGKLLQVRISTRGKGQRRSYPPAASWSLADYALAKAPRRHNLHPPEAALLPVVRRLLRTHRPGAREASAGLPSPTCVVHRQRPRVTARRRQALVGVVAGLRTHTHSRIRLSLTQTDPSQLGCLSPATCNPLHTSRCVRRTWLAVSE